MSTIKPSRLIRACVMASLPIAWAAPQSVMAQSVTLYGAVDAALMTSNNGAPGVGRINSVTSGLLTPSRWGLRGTEDLGDGLKATFLLESGFETDTGAAKTSFGNPATATATAPNGTAVSGFNRRSTVGLEGSFGTLNLGRDYTPIYFTGIQTDPMGFTLLGNVQAITIPAGGVERWGRVSNALFYTSPIFNGFKARAAYSLGSESGGGTTGSLPKRSNTFIGVGGDYVNGGLLVSASYQELYYPRVAGATPAFTGDLDKRKDAMLGAKYSFDTFSVASGYWRVDSPQKASNIWLGGSSSYGPFKVMAIVQKLRQDNSTGAERTGTVFGIGGVYDLSKRTTLYATYGRVSNNATASFALFSADTAVTAGVPGADPRAMAIGIRHSF